MSESKPPVRIGLVGAGIFARESHIPPLVRGGSPFEVRAIYSRTAATAQAAAELLPYPVAVMTDLEELLAREDIEAVDIVLPIPQLPAAVGKALAAGKHVISEKPIAPDMATGRTLVSEYRSRYPHLTWMVGENWRYETAFVRATELIQQGAIGRVRLCQCTSTAPVRPGDKYYATEWRRSGQFPGGFLLDGGVHHMALLRALLGEIATVTAATAQIYDDLPPADSVGATFHFTSGAIGVYMASYALGSPWEDWLHLLGEGGSLRVMRGKIELVDGEGLHTIACQTYDGVQNQLYAFAAAVRTGEPHRNQPEEALRDLAALTALLQSAELGRAVAPEPIE